MIHWNPSPEMIDAGPLVVRWYGALFAIGFYLGYRVTGKIFHSESRGQASLDRFFLYVFVGTLIGARLGHCLFYEPDVYLLQPWRIPMIWEGGLASHGAALGVFAACWLFSRRGGGMSALGALDRLAVSAPIAGAFIRVGNFFNSEIIGKPADLPWAVIFERIDGVPRHPAQLYEAFAYVLISGGLAFLWRKRRALSQEGLMFGAYLVLTFATRFVVEFFKENQASFESALPLNMGQILSVPMIAMGLFFIFRRTKIISTPKKPQ